MNICLIHGRRVGREVVTRGLSSKLDADVETFSCCENALAFSLDYDVFVVYNNFKRKMGGMRGVAEIRDQKPNSFIIGVTSNPNYGKSFLSAGADAFLLRAGNEIEEMVSIIQKEVERDPSADS